MAMCDDTNTFIRTHLIFESELKDSLKCGLCHKIMVDCCMTKCGCDFCRDCILRYFENNGDQINCPTCKSENIGSDIEENKSVNKKIRLVRVKCPNPSCTNIDTISNMANHVKECDKGKLSCPFINLGCNESEIIGNQEMKVHFGRNLVEHNEILINVLETLDNDIKVMKENMKNLTSQNEEKGNKINHLFVKVDELTNKNTELQDKVNCQELKINELENKVDQMEVRDLNLRRELEEYKTNSRSCEDKIDEFEIRFDDLLRNTGDGIKKVGEDAKIHVDRLSIDLAKVKSEYEKEIKTISTEINEVRNDMREEIEARSKNNKDNITKLENDLKDENEKLWQQISLDNYGDFVWKVEKLSEKRKEASEGRNIRMESRTFYSHKFGYRMKLRICPDGIRNFKGTDLGIWFVIEKGENDEILEWPCRRQIKLGLINQDNSEDAEVENYQVDTEPDKWKHRFDKPTELENFPLGFAIKWTQLNNSPHLLKNDILFIKCCTTP